jgi:hypothetical protein
MKWNIVGQGEDAEWSGEHVSIGLVHTKNVSVGYTGRKQKFIVRSLTKAPSCKTFFII